MPALPGAKARWIIKSESADEALREQQGEGKPEPQSGPRDGEERVPHTSVQGDLAGRGGGHRDAGPSGDEQVYSGNSKGKSLERGNLRWEIEGLGSDGFGSQAEVLSLTLTLGERKDNRVTLSGREYLFSRGMLKRRLASVQSSDKKEECLV